MSRLALLLVALPASAQQTIHLPAEFDGQAWRLFVVGTDGTLGRAAWWPSSTGTSRGLETVVVKWAPREVN